MITTHIELEEIEQKAEILGNLLLMLEKIFEGETNSGTDDLNMYFPTVKHLAELSGEVLQNLTELRLKYTKLSEAEANGK